MSGDGPACRTALALLACALLALPMLVALPPIARAAPPDYPIRPPPAYPPRPGEPPALNHPIPLAGSCSFRDPHQGDRAAFIRDQLVDHGVGVLPL